MDLAQLPKRQSVVISGWGAVAKWHIRGPKYTERESNGTDISVFTVLCAIFYVAAYVSVSSIPPSSIPVHHDDYSNYSAAAELFAWSWVRPLSTYIIHVLAELGPDWLIWTVRLLTVTYIFLSWKLLREFYRPQFFWPSLVLFGVAAFSTPIIVEYARYTGMITHLLSGCFGLAAVICLIRVVTSPEKNWIYLSIFFLVASTLAKEDFIFLYAISLLYVALIANKDRRKIIIAGTIGLLLCILLVAGAKFLAASSFLGVAEKASTYFIDTSPASVAKTVFRYLTGASHPAMIHHGLIIASTFFFSALAVIYSFVKFKTLPRATYFIVAGLCIIAPYSVLPNHVNAYYELIWLPMIFAAALLAFVELLERVRNVLKSFVPFCAFAAFLVLVASAAVYDYSHRKSIALWYDSVGASNAKLLGYLQSQKSQIEQARHVCIKGADSFSPWYMHDGQYLRMVTGLNATWYILIDEKSPYYQGMITGAQSSKGQVIVVATPEAIPATCLHVQL